MDICAKMPALCINMAAFNDEPKATERCGHHIHMGYNRVHQRPQACPGVRLKETANVSIALDHFGTCAS